jgi:hypothetical protein
MSPVPVRNGTQNIPAEGAVVQWQDAGTSVVGMGRAWNRWMRLTIRLRLQVVCRLGGECRVQLPQWRLAAGLPIISTPPGSPGWCAGVCHES